MNTIEVTITLLEIAIAILMVINTLRALYLVVKRHNKIPYIIQTFAFGTAAIIILMPDFLSPIVKVFIETFILIVLVIAFFFNLREGT